MNDKHNNNEDTNFGFKKVSFDNKKNLVNEVFSNVAPKYDLMNDLMSVGIHRFWKNKFCDEITELNSNILDVAGGTGDISFKIKERARKYNKTDNYVTICDINEKMLCTARDKALDKNFIHNLSFACANAEKLPFADNSFDYYTIAFGIRNVANIGNALKEAIRVLKPGGKFMCLEFSKVENDYLEKLYDFYSFNIIPKIAQIVTGSESAYQYLVESINLFPDQENFAIMIKQAGFQRVNYKNLSFGISAIHTAYKL